MNTKAKHKTNQSTAIFGLLLAVCLGLLAGMAWLDISVNLFQYNNPAAVTTWNWVGFIVPVASALVSTLIAIQTFISPRTWHRRALLVILILNVVVPILLWAQFFSSWGGTSFG